MIRSLACLSLALLAASIHVSCTGTNTTDASTTPIRLVSIVQFDEDLAVATFRFEQFEDGRITLKIVNILDPDTFDSTSFTYKIEFTPREVSDTSIPWKNEGAVTNLASGQTANQGVIATSAVPIDEGRLTIEFTSGPAFKPEH